MNDTLTTEPPRRDSGNSTWYRVSSFELRAGLEVSLLPISQLPVEVPRELHRLRHSWQQDLAPPSAAA